MTEPMKTVSARIPGDWAEHISALQDLGEIKNLRDIIEMGLEVFRPSGISAREYHIMMISKKIEIRKAEVIIEQNDLMNERRKEIDKLEGSLRSLKTYDDRFNEAVSDLIPRWVDILKMKVYGYPDPREILDERIGDTPDQMVEFFKPFGLAVTWTALSDIYDKWKGSK